MLKKGLGLVLVTATILLLALNSCSKEPFACFDVQYASQDSIHRFDLVTFDAGCSYNAGEYFWSFEQAADTQAFGPVVKIAFQDSGTVIVYLLVTNGNKQNAYTKDVVVYP